MSCELSWNLSRVRLGAKTLALALCVAIDILPGHGQTGQGAISGIVTDPTGATVAQAQITVKNTGTGLERVVTTGEGGTYVVSNLPVGTYDVSVAGGQFGSQ